MGPLDGDILHDDVRMVDRALFPAAQVRICLVQIPGHSVQGNLGPKQLLKGVRQPRHAAWYISLPSHMA